MSRTIRLRPLGATNLSQWFTVANGKLQFDTSAPPAFKDGNEIDCLYLDSKGLYCREYIITASTAKITPIRGEMPYRYWKRYSLPSLSNAVILGVFTNIEEPIKDIYPVVYVSGLNSSAPVFEIKVYSKRAENFKIRVKMLSFNLRKVS